MIQPSNTKLVWVVSLDGSKNTIGNVQDIGWLFWTT
jgi:hypothetical protein